MNQKFKLGLHCRGIAAVAVLLFVAPIVSRAQSPFKGFENLFTVPKSYVAQYTNTPPVIDGDINDAAWQKAQWTDDFVDIEGDLKPKPPLKTKLKLLWDDTCLYIAFKIQEPHVWATLTQHDAVVFRDNDVELFVSANSSTHEYFEIEYNAINTVFDLFLNKPYRNGGVPLSAWDAKGMRSAVKIQGTLNNPNDKDEGWTVETAIPFKSISVGGFRNVPINGATWRINFSRVEWDTKIIDGKYVKLKDSLGRPLPEHNWVWSPQGLIAMHCPERWGYLKFSKDNEPFKLPYSELQQRYLWLIYYQEKRWHDEHHSYTESLPAFGLNNTVEINGNTNTLKIEATEHQFMAFITDGNDKITWTINQEGLAKQLNSRTNE